MINFAACSQPEKEHPSGTKSPAANASWVGSETCAPCHAQIYDSFRQTGMGRSFSRPEAAKLAALLQTNPQVYEPKSDYNYSAHLRDGKLMIREFRRKNGRVIYQQERTAAFQVGSGNNTISFLEDRNGYLFEMPLTWYAEKKIWDMSPGYRNNNWRFDRPINGTCLNCHTGPSRRTPQTENHFESVRLGIGCENCHGPGSVHVSMAVQSPASKVNFEQTIVHPADLDRVTQMDICQRCHLEGIRIWNDGTAADEVEVGKRLSAHQGVFVSSDAHASESEFGIAAQADRLRKSACYQKSATMTCTTCHDPHQSPAHAGANDFNAKCTACHGMAEIGRDAGNMPATIAAGDRLLVQHEATAPACTAPSTRASDMQDCVNCHMKSGATSDIPHVRFTDHYIRREINNAPTAQRAADATLPFLVPMIYADTPAGKMLQQGLAYLDYHQTALAEAAYLDSTIFYLEAAARLGAGRKDGEDDYARGSAYFLLGKTGFAEAALRQAIAKNPAHARAHYILGRLLMQKNQPAQAAAIFAQGEQAQPMFQENAVGRGQALLADQQFEQALTALGEVLQKDSLSYDQAFYVLGQLWHNLGNFALARESYGRALALNPDLTLALLNLGATFMVDNRWQEAIGWFDRILERNAGYLPALLNKMLCLAELGQKREAQRIAQLVLELDSKNQTARALLQELREK